VSFNTRELVASCVAHALAAAPREVVVVDNASCDGTVDMLRERFPGVTVVSNGDNRGYGTASNQAMAVCKTPIVLLLNSDSRIDPRSVSMLDAYMRAHPEAAVVGPRLVDERGRLQPSTFPFPSVGDVLLGETGLHLCVRRIPGLRQAFWRTWTHDRARVVPWLVGAALAVRREPFEAVGGFDESYFMYSEEVDLCWRLRQAGYQIHFAPVTTVVHAGDASTRQNADAMRRQRLMSGARFLRRHESAAKTAAVLRTLQCIVFARWVRARLAIQSTRSPARQQHYTAEANTIRCLLADRILWRS
jgi:GT2 family glycosyltransferase